MSAIPDLRDLAALVDAPLGRAIGWALIQFVWQGALIGALAAITLAAMRRSAADVRYVVATIALSLMLTMPVVTARPGAQCGTGSPRHRCPLVTSIGSDERVPATAATARVAAAAGRRSRVPASHERHTGGGPPRSASLPVAFDAVGALAASWRGRSACCC